jgi:hydrogenase maturation protein HypF
MKKAYEIKISGIVQGVGFRPFIYRQAQELHLKGWVKNLGSIVKIYLEGNEDDTNKLVNKIKEASPPAAIVEKIEIKEVSLKNVIDFKIISSGKADEGNKFLSPDLAICSQCEKELFDPISKKYLYPFINCTNCGPRYSIIKELPYDRKSTTMNDFQMCASCTEEYENPITRRFHAQPNCCSQCGPKYHLYNIAKEVIEGNPIIKTQELLKQGKIVAIKGLSGFHLCCDATNVETVNKLRKMKNRPHKPLAIMAKDIEYAKKIGDISKKEEEILMGRASPIVIIKKKKGYHLPEELAPQQNRIGIMLPYTPMHLLLFENFIPYLVMTSGNLSGQPLQYNNTEALENLSTVADYFLFHNREIQVPIDDAIVKVMMAKEILIRPGRGYSPQVFSIQKKNIIETELLALGAMQKSTYALLKNGYVTLSEYQGDINDYECAKKYKNSINNLLGLYKANPEIVAIDMHPNYFYSMITSLKGKKVYSVQHHHAHMVSCMVEHNLNNQVIGVIYDGTGIGLNNTIWGGEIFVGDRNSFERVAHLQEVTLQGKDISIKEPWRCAIAYLMEIGLNPLEYINDRRYTNINEKKIEILIQVLQKKFNCFTTTSMGRFFDCVSALIGICTHISYDAQAAIQLENLIEDKEISELAGMYYPYNFNEENHKLIIMYDKILKAIIHDINEAVPISIISLKFHNTVIQFTYEAVKIISDKYGIKEVTLSGGVFQNSYLLECLYKKLINEGFTVYINELVPTNDSGISVGQAGVALNANFELKKGGV